jgi:hypothetical protein
MKNIYLIPTNKPSRLFIDIDDKKLKICVPLGGEHMMNQNIYITNDEVIKEGDWVIDDEQDVFQVLEINHTQGILRSDGFTYVIDICKKIILTTDQDLIGVQEIDDNFLKWFVKNPSCEEVEIDLVPVNEFGSEITVSGYGFDRFIYKIIIPQEEIELNKLKKQFQMKADEALELNSKIGNFGKEEPKYIEDKFEWESRIINEVWDKDEESKKETSEESSENKWQAERMYSEEDMIDFAEYVASYSDKNRNIHNQMLHAKSKYDGAERTIDLLEIWLKEFKTK